ncbi:MAG: hypothetical protein U0694_02200 [Anaerolineae bacterium]
MTTSRGGHGGRWTARTVYLRTGQHPTVPHLPPHADHPPRRRARWHARVLDVAQLEDVVYAVPVTRWSATAR